jgi:hypothetical protein
LIETTWRRNVSAGVVIGRRAIIFKQSEYIVAPDRCGIDPLIDPIQKANAVVDLGDTPERTFEQVAAFLILGPDRPLARECADSEWLFGISSSNLK